MPDAAEEDHPRRCGENNADAIDKVEPLGSPPQVRGKLAMVADVSARRQDHPRRCGENVA